MATGETAFSNDLRLAIKRLGIHCIKVSDRMTSGRPDLYACGGNWVEDKFIYQHKSDKPFTDGVVIRNFTALQLVALDTMQRAKDNSFVGIYWRRPPTKLANRRDYFMLLPYHYFKRVAIWSNDSIDILSTELPLHKEKKGIDPSFIFDPNYDRNVRFDKVDELWGIFSKHFPGYIYPNPDDTAADRIVRSWKESSLSQRLAKHSKTSKQLADRQEQSDNDLEA
jgi:hypothetical protein